MLDGICAEAIEDDPGYVSVRFEDDTGELSRRKLSVFEIAMLQRELGNARFEAQYIQDRARSRRKHESRRQAQLAYGRGIA